METKVHLNYLNQIYKWKMVISLHVIILPIVSVLSLTNISTTAHSLLYIVMSELSPTFTTKVMRSSTYISSFEFI